MIGKSDSKWISLAAASILGQAPSHSTGLVESSLRSSESRYRWISPSVE
ncbi:MAG: hypothetical protein V3V31_02330 [Methylococcales bacterium]